MTRIYAVVEGLCEQRFLSTLVAPSFRPSIDLRAMLVRRGGGGRGGGSRWEPWQTNLENLLSQERSSTVTMMVDLYRVPTNTPGYTEPAAGNGSARADAILSALRDAFPDPRFVPYVQVHEFETILFSDLDALPSVAEDFVDPSAFAALRKDVEHLPPEAVNDGPETHPARRLSRAMPGFKKTVHGLSAAELIGLAKIRSRCPRLDGWLSQLEQRASGVESPG